MLISLAVLITLAHANPQGIPGLGYLTAANLNTRCAETSATSATYCFAYLAGVHDAVRAYERWLATAEYCAPTDLPQAEIRRVFLSYFMKNPSISDAQAASVVVLALRDRFPCGKGTPLAPDDIVLKKER
jgi:hypothetical protein